MSNELATGVPLSVIFNWSLKKGDLLQFWYKNAHDEWQKRWTRNISFTYMKYINIGNWFTYISKAKVVDTSISPNVESRNFTQIHAVRVCAVFHPIHIDLEKKLYNQTHDLDLISDILIISITFHTSKQTELKTISILKVPPLVKGLSVTSCSFCQTPLLKVFM